MSPLKWPLRYQLVNEGPSGAPEGPQRTTAAFTYSSITVEKKVAWGMGKPKKRKKGGAGLAEHEAATALDLEACLLLHHRAHA